MKIDVTKVKRAIRGNERLILIAKAKIDRGESVDFARHALATYQRDHGHLIALRTGVGAELVPAEVAECYRAARFERVARRAS
jgi:hypothetical protein